MDLLINFDDLKPNNKALKKLVQAFTRAGAPVATVDTDGRAKRASGVTYRDVILTFVDNQKLTLSFKQSGDVFQVKLNGSVVPLKNQSDQIKAVGELVQLLDAGRVKHQAKLARQKVVMPTGLKTAAPRMEVKLKQANDDVDAEIAKARATVAELKAELGEQVLDGATKVELTEDDIAVAKANKETLMAIEKSGWDGDMPSKAERDELVKAGMVDRYVTEAENDCNVLNAKGKKALELVKSEALDSVDLPALLAQAKTVIAGEVLDDTHAVTNLRIALDVVETNYPIHVAEGKLDQAELEQSCADSFRQAIAILEEKQAA